MSHIYIHEKEAWNLVRVFEVNGLRRRDYWNITRQLQRWEKSRGMKWVVSRLKILANDLLTNSGDVKKHRDGTWYGPLRPISIIARFGISGLTSALACLYIYSRFESRRATSDDFRKFCKSIKLPEDQVVPELKITPEDQWLAKDAIKHSDFNYHYDASETRSSPVGGMETIKRAFLTPYDHALALDACPFLVRRHYVFLTRLFDLRPETNYGPNEGLRYRGPRKDHVGVIRGLTDDGGLKIRYIANPAYYLQVAMSRLQRALDQFLASMPESCVHNQDAGPKWISKKFRQKASISSIDLSKCSDNLPAREQFTMLSTLFGPELKEDIALFESVSRAYWRTPVRGLSAVWTKGQPLGTAPSFACFTIFHILLVRSVGGDASNFRIIGDDIVVADDDLTDRVMTLYNDLKVEVSLTKSIFKNRKLAQFAGRLVTRRGVLPLYKGRKLKIEKDPLGYIRQYGIAGVKLLPKRVRLKFWAVSLLPRPFGYGRVGIIAYLPDRLVYELYVDRFKPKSVQVKLPPIMQVYFSQLLDQNTLFDAEGPIPMVPQTQSSIGEGAWLASCFTEDAAPSGVSLLGDHVQSWTNTPLEDVPDVIQTLERELVQFSSTEVRHSEDVYRHEPPKPISFVNKVYRLMRKYVGRD